MIRKITKTSNVFDISMGRISLKKREEIEFFENSRSLNPWSIAEKVNRSLKDELLEEVLFVLGDTLPLYPTEVYRNPFLSHLSSVKESVKEISYPHRYGEDFLNSISILVGESEKIIERVEKNLYERGARIVECMNLDKEVESEVLGALRRLRGYSPKYFLCKDLGFGLCFPSYGWVTIKF